MDNMVQEMYEAMNQVLKRHNKEVEYGNVSMTIKQGKVTNVSVSHNYQIEK